MNNQSLRIATQTLLPAPGSRFSKRYEACRQALSDRGHATAQRILVSISSSAATGTSGGSANPPASHDGQRLHALTGQRSASLFSPAADPTRQLQSHAMLIRQALGGLR
jgi:hypothetical protein